MKSTKQLLIEQLLATGQDRLVDWLFGSEAERTEALRQSLQKSGHFDLADDLCEEKKK